MEKNNYLLRISNPKKKKFNEKYNKSIILSSNFNNNSSLALKNKNLDLKKVKSLKQRLNKKNKSIIIFNYKSSNKYYNIKNNITYSSKTNSKMKQKIKNKKNLEKRSCPGNYNLIWINANNSSKKRHLLNLNIY
jgi:hypothetical protein